MNSTKYGLPVVGFTASIGVLTAVPYCMTATRQLR